MPTPVGAHLRQASCKFGVDVEHTVAEVARQLVEPGSGIISGESSLEGWAADELVDAGRGSRNDGELASVGRKPFKGETSDRHILIHAVHHILFHATR